MDFELSEDEQSLAAGMRRLCTGRFSLEKLRDSEGRRAVDRGAWAELAEAGLFSLRLDEELGGLGLGLGAAAVVFEEVGRALVPGPVVSTHVAAGLLPEAAGGDVVVCSLRTPGGALPSIAADLGSADQVLVFGDDDVRIVDAAAVEATALERSLDPLTPLWQVHDVAAGRTVAEGEAARRLRWDYVVLEGALLVGNAAATLDMAVAYAQQREQFGRAIGSFQAVKHLCADMLVRAETARCAVQAAAVTADQPGVGDATRAAAGAGVLAAEAALLNAKTCIQVHGGMGFTWEVPAHLYLMRARLMAESLRPSGALLDTVADRF